MIKKNLFMSIFPDINNISLDIINNDEYLIINIVPEILNFKSGCREICNTYNVFYNKCSLYAFNSAFVYILKIIFIFYLVKIINIIINY